MENLNLNDVNSLFEKADYYEKALKDKKVIKDLEGKILATLFYQPSTRTRMSFTSAMYRLGGQVIDMGGPKVARTDDYFDESMSGSVAKLKLYAHLYKTIKANIVLTVKSFVSINYFSFFSINIT
ncbi:hypothetical protein [Staphylococcus epidermidis]|uniref:hypothetical protein n=1 Tax=Staphylococcus epidermidis TaxID=1282 RepID=UPI00374F4F34